MMTRKALAGLWAVVLALALCVVGLASGTARAQGLTVQGDPQTTPQHVVDLLQRWTDSSLVPTAPGATTVHMTACYFGDIPAYGCTTAPGDDVWLMPGIPGRLRAVWLHEIGHVFDFRVMSTAARDKWRRMLGDSRSWDAKPGQPSELFADAYSLCARHAALRTWPHASSYGYMPSPRFHLRACRLIEQVAAGAYGPPDDARSHRRIYRAGRGPPRLGVAIRVACVTPTVQRPPCPLPFDPRYARALNRFDQFTAEDAMKALWTQPSATRWDFAAGDEAVAIAGRLRRPIRGHALVYPAADPQWLKTPAVPWTRESLLAEMRNRIGTMMRRYPTVTDWDVVNEPFATDGTRDQNVYERVIGGDWIEQAFGAARAANPRARLTLNEYGIESPTARAQAVYQLAADFRARGVPLDQVGIEAHTGADGMYPTLGALRAQIHGYSSLGLNVALTEADVLPPPTGRHRQLHAWSALARACAAEPACDSMTVWGVADRYSWRGVAARATLLDRRLRAKRAYRLVRRRLHDKGS